jgi:hypothetical protein
MDKALSELNRRWDTIDEKTQKAVIEDESTTAILNTLRGVGMNQAVLFDKMRLEGGQSTQNHSLAGIVSHFHENVGFFDQSTGKVKQSIVKAPANVLKQPAHNVTGTSEDVDTKEN